MNTGSDELKELFETLKTKGINKSISADTFAKWDRNRLIDLLDEIFEKTPFIEPESVTSKDPFNFNASPVLSGGRFPCSSFECRGRTADKLARFASLYAEHALIFHPIEDMRGYLKKTREIEFFTIDAIADDFKLLFYYQPLLETGLIGIRKEEYFLCKECTQKVKNEIKKVERVIKKIVEINSNKFQVLYGKERGTNIRTVEIEGPEEFIGTHGYITLLDRETAPYRKRNDNFWINRVIAQRVSGIFPPFMTNNFSYLTNNELDIDVLRYTTKQEFPEFNNSLLAGFSHDLPFIHDIPFSRLIELRKKEGEAFKVYRDALRLALKSVENTAENKSQQVFNDIVLPELNKIDNTVKASKKILTRNRSEDLIISAGVVGMGLFAGLISPTVGACLTAVGGVNFASGLLKQASHVVSEPLDIRDNSYYFLWKVRKESEKKGRKL